MLRQIGLAVGVAVLIAVLGSPDSRAVVLNVYERASYVIAAAAFVAGLLGLVLLARRPRAKEVAGSSATAAVAVGGTR
jgi:hypothetical protein